MSLTLSLCSIEINNNIRAYKFLRKIKINDEKKQAVSDMNDAHKVSW